MSLLLSVLILAAAGAAVGAVLVILMVRQARRRAGYGIQALAGFTGERTVSARVVEVPDWTGGWEDGALAETPYTVLTVPHSAELPWVVEINNGSAERLDKRSFAEWASSRPDAIETPSSLRSGDGDRQAEEQAETFLGQALAKDDLLRVRGTVRLEPAQVRFVERGDLLEPGYLRMVAGLLLQLTEEAEKAHPPEETAQV